MKKLDFMIVGAQKSGTTALAHFLSQHPDIGLARPAEAHAFDHEAYSGKWTDALLDEYYGGYFSHLSTESVLGESTPIYLYLADVPAEMARWQPALKLVVILRDPVDRAWSHYCMVRENGLEHLPFWLALLVEPLRLWLGSSPLARHSALRENSYRGRGLYARQLRRYLACFPREQILVLRNEDLASEHEGTMARVFEFLGVEPGYPVAPERLNSGSGQRAPWPVRLLLRVSFWYDLWRLSRLVDFPLRRWIFRV